MKFTVIEANGCDQCRTATAEVEIEANGRYEITWKAMYTGDLGVSVTGEDTRSGFTTRVGMHHFYR